MYCPSPDRPQEGRPAPKPFRPLQQGRIERRRTLATHRQVASSDPASAHPDTTTAANISVATNQRYTQLSMFVMVRVSAVFWALAEQNGTLLHMLGSARLQ